MHASSRHRVDGVEVDAAIQDERAVNLISTQVPKPPTRQSSSLRRRPIRQWARQPFCNASPDVTDARQARRFGPGASGSRASGTTTVLAHQASSPRAPPRGGGACGRLGSTDDTQGVILDAVLWAPLAVTGVGSARQTLDAPRAGEAARTRPGRPTPRGPRRPPPRARAPGKWVCRAPTPTAWPARSRRSTERSCPRRALRTHAVSHAGPPRSTTRLARLPPRPAPRPTSTKLTRPQTDSGPRVVPRSREPSRRRAGPFHGRRLRPEQGPVRARRATD